MYTCSRVLSKRSVRNYNERLGPWAFPILPNNSNANDNYLQRIDRIKRRNVQFLNRAGGSCWAQVQLCQVCSSPLPPTTHRLDALARLVHRLLRRTALQVWPLGTRTLRVLSNRLVLTLRTRRLNLLDSPKLNIGLPSLVTLRLPAWL